ncbi:hypothetical protein, partial [Burkholderia vietnamiensis]|uniref:hypothetical protein n=1 Tax=Burkholderia vietnamiensis TaxID=60552 RepID=UPI001BA3D18E
MKPRQGRGRAGFNEIESRQKVVRASFGAAQKAESPRVAGRVQHDLRRGRQAPHGKPFGEPFGEPFSKRQRHPAVIVVAFPQQELSDWRPLPARSTRSLETVSKRPRGAVNFRGELLTSGIGTTETEEMAKPIIDDELWTL